MTDLQITKVKFMGPHGETHWLNLDESQYSQIKEIITNGANWGTDTSGPTEDSYPHMG